MLEASAVAMEHMAPLLKASTEARLFVLKPRVPSGELPISTCQDIIWRTILNNAIEADYISRTLAVESEKSKEDGKQLRTEKELLKAKTRR